jgi:succinyl-CoA synthetase alpha subunit
MHQQVILVKGKVLMAIIVNQNTKVIVQGITGKQGSFHTRQMLTYGTKVVAGVTPGKGGITLEGVPVYDTVQEVLENHQVDATVIFVQSAIAKDAVLEALEAGIGIVVVITEHIPVHDALKFISYAQRKRAILIGPNTFGIISSGKCKIGIPPNQFFIPGPVGLVSRSGTLTYEISEKLVTAGFGQSTAVGIGGDCVKGLTFTEILKLFEADPETNAVVLIGEIGGNAEEEASVYIKEMTKPVVAYIAGKSAPPEKQMGHAGAIIRRGRGTYQSKVKALSEAGALVAEIPSEVPAKISKLLV